MSRETWDMLLATARAIVVTGAAVATEIEQLEHLGVPCQWTQLLALAVDKIQQ